MILTDSMLDAAFGFRETEAWKMLDDSNIFAVRLSNGQNVYCTIMGNGGEHYSLGIYINEEGFSSYLRILNSDGSMINNLRFV
jgi:chemotaxis methyl-accepting protein methylase